MIVSILVVVLAAGLAGVNGANDVSKGVAALVGNGVTKYRTAVLWGAATTLAGCLLSGLFAERMLKLFTSGIVSEPPTSAFTLAVMCGVAGWVAVATLTKLPVSTTHAIIGSLIGAGLLFAPASVAWAGLATRLALPLLASIAISYAVSALLNKVVSARAEASGGPARAGGDEAADGARSRGLDAAPDAAGRGRGAHGFVVFDTAVVHWFSSGAVGFARGLNDAPKLVALAIAVLGQSTGLFGLLLLVSGAMFAGSLLGGRRVAEVLAERVVTMTHREGLLANVTTAVLVGFGANLGLPMSTTHVATGAIAGIAGAEAGRLNRKTLRDLALAWTVTPVVAGVIAAGAYLVASRVLA